MNIPASLKAALIAVGVGGLIGFALGKRSTAGVREERKSDDDYIAPPEPEAHLMQILRMIRVGSCAIVAARLRIASHLSDGPKTIEELSSLAGAHSDSLLAVLRSLAAHGVFVENGDDMTFRNNATSLLLRDESEWSSYTLLRGHQWSSIGDLLYTAQTGKPSWPHVHNGQSVYEWYKEHPTDRAEFDRAMSAKTRTMSQKLASGFDWSPFRTIVDVGGGIGTLLAEIVKLHPSINAINFDQSHVIETARQVCPNLTHVVSTGFFEGVPTGSDAIVMKEILHNYDDTKALQILRTIAPSIAKTKRVFIIEHVLPPFGDHSDPAAKDQFVTMSFALGARERTAVQWKRLVETPFNGSSLYRLVRVHPFPTGCHHIIETERV